MCVHSGRRWCGRCCAHRGPEPGSGDSGGDPCGGWVRRARPAGSVSARSSVDTVAGDVVTAVAASPADAAEQPGSTRRLSGCRGWDRALWPLLRLLPCAVRRDTVRHGARRQTPPPNSAPPLPTAARRQSGTSWKRRSAKSGESSTAQAISADPTTSMRTESGCAGCRVPPPRYRRGTGRRVGE